MPLANASTREDPKSLRTVITVTEEATSSLESRKNSTAVAL